MHVFRSAFTAHSQASHASSDRQPPAKAARDLIQTTRSDLAERPFGQIVSLIARGIDLPASANAADTADSASEVSSFMTNSNETSEPPLTTNSDESGDTNQAVDVVDTGTDVIA